LFWRKINLMLLQGIYRPVVSWILCNLTLVVFSYVCLLWILAVFMQLEYA
jgi:hypothetical protein